MTGLSPPIQEVQKGQVCGFGYAEYDNRTAAEDAPQT
jgi:hypothetical protein